MTRHVSKRDWLAAMAALLFGIAIIAIVVAGVLYMRHVFTAPPRAEEITRIFPEFTIAGATFEGLEADRDVGLYRFRYVGASRGDVDSIVQRATSAGWVEVPELRTQEKTALSKAQHGTTYRATIRYADNAVEITRWDSSQWNE